MDTPKQAEPEKPDPNDAYGPPDEDDGADIEPLHTPKPAKVVEPPKEPVKPVISPALRRMAKSYGISEEDIEASNPDTLQDAISFLAEDRARLQAKVEPDDDEDDDDDAIEKLDKELSLDPRMKKLLKKSSASAKEIKELKAALTAQTERERARVTRAGSEAVDEGFDALGDDFKAIFGDGDHKTLSKDSKELKRRVSVFHASGVDLASDSPSAIKRKITKAAKEMFSDFVTKKPKAEAVEEEETVYEAPKKAKAPREGPDVTGMVRDWDEAATARPTNRKAPEKKGRQSAINAAREYMREIPSASEDVFNGVPE